jgi:hypothetical protein
MCQYDLTGLPEVHTCPECGFEYDPHAQVIRLFPQRRIYGHFVAAGTWMVPILLLRRGAFSQQDAALFLGSIAVVLLVTTFYWSRIAGSPRRLVLNRHGVRFDHPSISGEAIPWAGLAKAEFDWVFGKLWLISPQGTTLHEVPYRKLGSTRLSRRCADEINRLAALYAQAAPTTTADPPGSPADISAVRSSNGPAH